MKIDEAVKAAIETGRCIQRKSYVPAFGCLIPTNTPDGIIVIVPERGKTARWWHPTADDLIADDWELCEIRKEVFSNLK